MSIEVDRLARVRLYEEPLANYGIDNTANLATQFVDVPIVEGTLQTPRPIAMLEPALTKQRKDAKAKKVQGLLAGAGVSFDTYLAGNGVLLSGVNTPVGAAAGTPNFWAGRLLKILMGGERLETPPGVNTTVQAAPGPTASTFSVNAGHGTRFLPGTIIGIAESGTSRVHYREVLSVTTDAIALKVDLPFVPTAGMIVRGGNVYYLTEDPQTSAQWVVERKEATHRYAYLGCQGGFGFTIERGQIVRMPVRTSGAKWIKLGSSALAVATHSHLSMIAAKDSITLLATVGSTTRTQIHVGQLTITPNITYIDQPTLAGVEGIARKVRDRAIPVATVTALVAKDAAGPDWEALRTAETAIAIFQQLGTTGGASAHISLPTLQVVDVQDQANAGLDGWLVTMEAREDEAIASPSTDLAYSALRVAFGG